MGMTRLRQAGSSTLTSHDHSTNPRRAGRRISGVAAVGALLTLGIGAAAMPVAALPRALTETAAPASGSFADLSTRSLWRMIHDRGDRAVVGLKDDAESSGMRQGQILVDDAERQEAEAAVRAVAGVDVLSSDDVLPFLSVKLGNSQALAKLRASKYVEYVEPATFEGSVEASGCTSNDFNTDPEGGDVSSGPWDPVAGGDLAPRNYRSARIQEAWGRSPGGAGITVGVMDTGVFDTQTQLRPASAGGRFDVGMSAGRSITLVGATSDHSAWDTCNHGTRSAGTIAGPRDGVSLAGIAYRSNLIAARVNQDVFVDAWETDALVLGIRSAVDNGARIISMAIGTGSWAYSNITQEIQYDYYNKGVLFIGAAGTTYCLEGVIYPAKLPEVVAVAATTATGAKHPDSCSGPEVDIAADIDYQSAIGRRPQDIISFGGSSGATAVAAGTAALIWSKYPTMTRDQVRDRLIWSGRGAVEANLGNGMLDAYKGVGGLYRLAVNGPTTVLPGDSYTLSAVASGDGPYSYRWSNGSTAPTITATAGASGTSQTFTVQVTDQVDGQTFSANKVVRSYDPDTCTRLCK